MNVLARPMSTMAPMSATPSDEPSCCPVYCKPSGLAASRVFDRGLDDIAELGDHEAHPDPEHAHAEWRTRRSTSVGLIVASRISVPAMVTIRPARTMVRTGKRLESLEPIAEVSEHRDRDGQHLDAGLQGVEAQDELEVERDHEEDAHQDQVLAEQPDQPRPHRRDPRQ